MRISELGCILLLLLLLSAAACGGPSSTPVAPTNFTITVTSPNTNVLVTATEQMTATASDGRALTGGTWSSDNTAVATVSSTGLVTATGAGQATIIFAASSGQVGTKLLHVFGSSISSTAGSGQNGFRFGVVNVVNGTARFSRNSPYRQAVRAR